STDHRYQSELYARGRDDLFFFFQAEDGIRDFHVTGVQTCALPISPSWPSGEVRNLASSAASSGCSLCVGTARNDPPQLPPPPGRSEERRVGKEARSRGSPDRGRNTP